MLVVEKNSASLEVMNFSEKSIAGNAMIHVIFVLMNLRAMSVHQVNPTFLPA